MPPLIPILMIVLGALVYALSSNGKVQELGRMCAGAGFIGLALAWVPHFVALTR
jgi:hypothetical protein